MRINTTIVILLLATLSGLNSMAQSAAPRTPVILGKGVGLFEVGALLASDDFKTLENWIVQIQENKKSPPPKVAVKEQSLDCFLPGRGCTVWFKQKLKTRVTISYDVICPSPPRKSPDLLPRDINNFWMAGDPGGNLFDSKKYTGDFSSYDQMHGYYASTGGGKNTTTRMRRYPRKVDGKAHDHPALIARDGKPGYLITPDKEMRVQLVAYDDVMQYLVDGKLVYEMAHGDAIQVEGRDADGRRVMSEAKYTPERFPIYREGYFGFRMVGTHHIYSNFKVHTLIPARPKVRASSIEALREAVTRSNQRIVMTPGIYVLPGMIEVRDLGSNNTIFSRDEKE